MCILQSGFQGMRPRNTRMSERITVIVEMFNSYGLNLCDDMGTCGCSLFKHAGLGKPKYTMDPRVRALHGHVQGEAVVDNRYHLLDIDESVFYLDRENETLIGGDDVPATTTWSGARHPTARCSPVRGENGSGLFCAKHPTGRSGERVLTFFRGIVHKRIRRVVSAPRDAQDEL